MSKQAAKQDGQKPTLEKASAAAAKAGAGDAEMQALIDRLVNIYGFEYMLRLAAVAREELTRKHRLIVVLVVLLTACVIGNIVQYQFRPEPKVISETVDGRIRELPTLDQPLMTTPEVISWAERCVVDMYDLAYTNWAAHLQSERTLCLSDVSRKGFTDSLKQIGVLSYLSTEYQGVLSASPRRTILRSHERNKDGYYQWILAVPYRLSIDGKRTGALELTMIMKIRRVSLNVREKGVWIETYTIVPGMLTR